jgi:SAM domain (Sterile alpha motif)
MLDLAEWLEAQGFGQYAELFADNAIDREALVELSDEHLKELGLPLGHRVKLLKAIRQLREPEAGPAADQPTPPTSRVPAAERRQLSVRSAIWSARPSWRRSSIPRTWAA